jgi:hypothetical protein
MQQSSVTYALKRLPCIRIQPSSVTCIKTSILHMNTAVFCNICIKTSIFHMNTAVSCNIPYCLPAVCQPMHCYTGQPLNTQLEGSSLKPKFPLTRG